MGLIPIPEIVKMSLGKVFDLVQKILPLASLKFRQMSIIIHYSHFDEQGNHVGVGGTKMICTVLANLAIYNSSHESRTMMDTEILVELNGQGIPLEIYNKAEEKWQTVFNLAPRTGYIYSCDGVKKGTGFRQHSPGMIKISSDGTDTISFFLHYRDELGHFKKVPFQAVEVQDLRKVG